MKFTIKSLSNYLHFKRAATWIKQFPKKVYGIESTFAPFSCFMTQTLAHMSAAENPTKAWVWVLYALTNKRDKFEQYI